MKMHERMSVMALSVAGALGLVAAPGSPAQTTEATAESMAATTTSDAVGAPATATTSAAVAISGTVSGLPESVSLSGKATIESRVVWSERNPADPATVTLDINLSGLSGKGSSSGAKYITAAREISVRRLTATDLVEISFLFYRSGTTGLSDGRTGVVTFSLAHDVNTGVLTGVSGRVGGM
jgi:hypothetical protein